MVTALTPVRSDPGAINRVVARHQPEFAGAFLEGVSRMRGRGRLRDSVAARAMAQAAGGAEPTAVLAVVDDAPVLKAETLGPTPPEVRRYARVILDAARATAPSLAGAFSLRSPWVQRAAREMAGAQVTQINAETRAALRRTIADAVADGLDPRRAGRLVRRVIGLTEAQAARVGALRRSLAAEGLGPGAVEQRVRAEAGRLLRQRASTISRTETLRAANVGQRETWLQAADRGLLDPGTFRMRWVPDADPCPRCAALDGATVALDGTFEDHVGGVTAITPPLHPRCECTLVADFGEA